MRVFGSAFKDIVGNSSEENIENVWRIDASSGLDRNRGACIGIGNKAIRRFLDDPQETQ